MAEYEKKVRDLLKQHDCHLVQRGNGDHDIWYSPFTDINVTVDGKTKSRHTTNAIMKQAGINFKFS